MTKVSNERGVQNSESGIETKETLYSHVYANKVSKFSK